MSDFFIRHACPACGSEGASTVYECDYANPPLREWVPSYYQRTDIAPVDQATYRLQRCASCGLLYQTDAPDDFARTLYEEWLDPAWRSEADKDLQTVGCFLRQAADLATLVNLTGRRPADLRILDVGCGWGHWAIAAVAMGCDAYGIELSESRAEFATAHGVKMIGYSDLERYDIINLEQVLEHVPNPLETLQTLVPALEGFMLISVPDGSRLARPLKTMDWSAPRYSRLSLMPVYPLEHVNCFTHRSLVVLARRARLQPVKIPLRVMPIGGHGENLTKLAMSLALPLYLRTRPGTTSIFHKL